ncbi:MAG: hypothetical protein U1C52_02375, partial [Patescibacteria group bacterium]|nr:hypothetical protein [Patescibacteria group bacterium]
KLFRFVPFVEFVLASGSLATGKVHEGSDFDVMVGVRPGRIFTARFFAFITFDLIWSRRRAVDHSKVAPDKMCLNHFVTPVAYKLKPPHDGTWEELYRSLVPIMGDEDKIIDFFKANDWLKPPRVYTRSDRYLGPGSSLTKSTLEFLLGGFIGDLLERLKWLQIRKIEKGLGRSMGKKGRVVYTDDELQFHPDRSKWVS